jgi:hypothetical protein
MSTTTRSNKIPQNPRVIKIGNARIRMSYHAMDAETERLKAVTKQKLTQARARLSGRAADADENQEGLEYTVIANPYDVRVTFTDSRASFKRLSGSVADDGSVGMCAYTKNGIVVGVFDGLQRTMIHECVHASQAILKRVGIDARGDGGEANAYLTEWLWSEGSKVVHEGGAAPRAKSASASDSGNTIKGRFIYDSLNIGKHFAPKPTVLTNDDLRAMYKAHAAGTKAAAANVKKSRAQDSGISAYMSTPQEEERNKRIAEEQGLSGAGYPTTGANHDALMDAYFAPKEDCHTSMDDVFRDPEAKSLDNYFNPSEEPVRAKPKVLDERAIELDRKRREFIASIGG